MFGQIPPSHPSNPAPAQKTSAYLAPHHQDRNPASRTLPFFALGALSACGGGGGDGTAPDSNAPAGGLPATYQPPPSTYTPPGTADPNLFALLPSYVAPYWVAALTSDSSEQIKADYAATNNVILYAFPVTVPAYVTGTSDASGWASAPPAVQATFETVFAGLEAIFDVDFVEVTNASADNVISIQLNQQTTTSGYAYFPTTTTFLGADIFLSNTYANPQDFGALTNFDYELIIHELGHALGFKHPFEADGSETTVLSADEDNSVWTVLTYTDIETAYDGFFRPIDLMALADLFGVNPDYRSGNDTYAFSASRGTFIIDGGGTDLVTAEGSSLPAYIDLRSGMQSHLGTKSVYITGANQLTISAGSVIENATGGSGNDHLVGNAAANVLFGAGGDDRLFGGDGSDQLRGGSGNDVIDLSEVVSTADRLIFETTLSLNGRDTVYAFAQGASGDVIDIRSFDGANLLAVVTSALVPVATVGGTILRLVLDGLDTATELDGALSSDGAFANLSLGAGTEALVLAADSQATGEDQHLFHVISTGADLVVSHLATFVGNYLDIDSWHANNFA